MPHLKVDWLLAVCSEMGTNYATAVGMSCCRMYWSWRLVTEVTAKGVAVIAVSQLVAAEISVYCKAEQASTAHTSGAVLLPG